MEVFVYTFIYGAMLFTIFFLLLRVVLVVFILKSAYFDGWEAGLCVLLCICIVFGKKCFCANVLRECRWFLIAPIVMYRYKDNKISYIYTSIIARPLLYRKMGECATFNLPRLLSTHFDWIHFFVVVLSFTQIRMCVVYTNAYNESSNRIEMTGRLVGWLVVWLAIAYCKRF